MAGLLRLEGLSKRYPNGKGVGPVDLVLEEGIHGILGPNGSGKTTLLKTILGFHAPTAGRATVLGCDVATESLRLRRQVGYMPESDVFVPGLNAVQTVRLAAELCGIAPTQAHEAAAEALQAVGLGEEAYHAPHRLSTGQRQKMKLAAALVHAPRLLVLDEPTNGLDPLARATMLALVRELAVEKGMSVLLSTHILPDVQALCRDAVMLRGGQVAGQEAIAARHVLAEGRASWFRVEVLTDPATFVEAARAAALTVREDGGRLLVLAPDWGALQHLARSSGSILATAAPATTGAEEAILQALEGTA